MPSDKKRADRFIFASLLALLLWMPLPWGSHVPWAQTLFITLATLLLSSRLMLSAFGIPRLNGRPSRLYWPLLLWLFWIAWIGFQLIPLSPDFLSKLSPLAMRYFATIESDQPALPLTISIGRGLTIDSLLLTMGYFAIYWLIVLTCWRQPDRVRWVLGTLVLSGGMQALYGSLMTLSGWEFGFFEAKQHYVGYATGTFVNRNHLAGYLELTAAAGIGLILADLKVHRQKIDWMGWLNDFIGLLFSVRFRTRIILAIIAVGIVMTRSRMGNTAFFMSLCLCGLTYIFFRERRLMLKALLLFGSLLIIDLMIVSNWFGLARVVNRIETTDMATESRTQVYDELPPVVVAYQNVGSGLGTFWQAYAPYRSQDMRYFYDHAHNDYLEMLIEVGWPGIFILAVLVGGHAVHAVHVIVRRRSRLPPAVCFATVMALVAYALHSTVDFNLQIPANAATLIALMALSACFSSQSRRESSEAAKQFDAGRRSHYHAPPVDS